MLEDAYERKELTENTLIQLRELLNSVNEKVSFSFALFYRQFDLALIIHIEQKEFFLNNRPAL